MRFIEERNEVIPDLAPAVKSVWESVGTYILQVQSLLLLQRNWNSL